MPALAYKRILLKLSGEALGNRGSGIDLAKLQAAANIIKTAKKLGVQIGIVMGGGNWWRKRDAGKRIEPVTSDYIGMLGTVLNSLALRDVLKRNGVRAVVQSFLVTAPGLAKVNIKKAVKDLSAGQVVIFAAGTGKPFVTTDTAAAQRARDIKASAIFKVGDVDGVYTADPNKNRNAKKFSELTFTEAARRRLKIFDQGAYKICQRAKIPLVVFKLSRTNLLKALRGGKVGTIIS